MVIFRCFVSDAHPFDFILLETVEGVLRLYLLTLYTSWDQMEDLTSNLDLVLVEVLLGILPIALVVSLLSLLARYSQNLSFLEESAIVSDPIYFAAYILHNFAWLNLVALRKQEVDEDA